MNECITDQELQTELLAGRHVHSAGGSTFWCEITWWLPPRKWRDVKFKIDSVSQCVSTSRRILSKFIPI